MARNALLVRKNRRFSFSNFQNREYSLDHLEERVVMSATVVSSFPGLNFAQSGGYVPPDTCGAVGTTSYVETVNQTVAIYNKSTGANIDMTPLSNFYFTTGGLARADASSRLSDPVVVYVDQIGKFVVGDQDVNFTTHVSTFDIAVSKTGTPASLSAADWNFYRFVTTEAGYDADYPGNIGFNNDALIVTLNMFAVSSGSNHTQVLAVSNNDLNNGVAAPAAYNSFVNSFSMRPSTMHDAVAGDPMWFVAEYGDNASINVIKMTNVLSSTPTYAATRLAVTPYSIVVPPLNPNGSMITNRLDSRILKTASSNKTLVATHHVSVSSTQDVAQWYNINVASGTPVLADQGRVSSGPNTYVYFPGIDINAAGQIGMSFMQSGTDTSTDYMSMYVTGRLPTDAAGTMMTPVVVPAGQGLANYSDFSPTGRAGDLSGINIDPVDGSFWASNEYATSSSSNNWGTAIAHFNVNSGIISSISGNVYDVDTASGIANVRIYNDVNNNGQFDATQVAGISDSKVLRVLDLKTVTKTVVVSGAVLPIYGMTVTVNLPHRHIADLVVTLISPAGTQVILANRQGGNGQNLTNTTFSDFAASQLPNNLKKYNSSYIPFNLLSTLNGQSANGVWTLQVSDMAFGDIGSLKNFSVDITTTQEANVLTDAAGNYTFLNAAAGNWRLRADLSGSPTWFVAVPLTGEYSFVLPPNTTVTGRNFGIKRT